MNVLFVLSLGFDRPGPSIHLLTDLMEALAARGHVLTVIQQHTGGPDPELPPALSQAGVISRTIAMQAPGKDNFIGRYLNRLRYARAAAKLMAGRYDAVYIHSCQTLYPLLRAARRRCPGARVVVNVQDIFPQNARAVGMMGASNPLYRALARSQAKAYRGADRVITLSEDMKATLVAAGADPQKVAVIPPWTYCADIEAVDQSDNAFLARYPDARGRYRVVYAGNVGQMQNVDIVLEAARLLEDDPDVLFMVVGGGARADQLRHRARDMKNLRFYPMQPPAMAAQVYAMAHINLITLAPGVTATAFPSKTAICMAVGRPIVAAVDAGSRYAQMIEGLDSCAAIPAGDASALAQAVRALRQAGAARSRGARALYAGPLSRQAGIAAHVELFDRLAKGEGL